MIPGSCEFLIENENRLRQVPELQKLRRQHFSASNFAFPNAAATFLSDPAARGVQLEISARLKFPEFRTGRFGLRVLANASCAESSAAEYTEVGFERAANHSRVYVDRRRSSGGVRDADIRSGPWVPTGSVTNLHVFVDRSIVTLIADNVTSISLWVHPTDVAASQRVALFSGPSIQGVHAEQIDVWQLADPESGMGAVFDSQWSREDGVKKRLLH
jgi:hypothetical protein